MDEPNSYSDEQICGNRVAAATSRMKWKHRWFGFSDKEMTNKGVILLLKWRGFKKWMRELLKEWIMKEVSLDLGLEVGNALLQSSITPSVTPIIRSSPCHEILVCRWLLVTINQYCDRRNGKGEFREFTSYQHGVVSITWWNKTELQAHRWVNRMI